MSGETASTTMKLLKPGRARQVVTHIVFVIICVICLYPLALVIGISFSTESSIAIKGFRLIPLQTSLVAYNFVLKQSDAVIRAYVITIIVTCLGTLLSTLVIALYAYPLSRRDFPQRKLFSFIAFFTMLFSGGLVPWYIVCVQLLHLRNNIWALFLPYTMNAWYVLIMRTFYKTNVPDSIVESAKMDGAGEYTIFFRIIISLAKPGLATIALFNTIVFWNDWWLPLMLVNDPAWFNLQYLMYRVQVNIQYLSSMAGNTNVAGEILRRLPSRTAQMAMCILSIGPIVLAYPFFQKYFVKGITIGSLKE
ncbi:MAG TPA: carbohydrate ABC transporter permease [Spirochaetia bacterium]|nr:carbohydrate ABC transporter permease [Spirochaetia bacterium]